MIYENVGLSHASTAVMIVRPRAHLDTGKTTRPSKIEMKN